MQMTLEYLSFVERTLYRSGKSSLEMLNENVAPVFVLFAISHFSPFLEEFDEKIQILKEAGLCPYRLISNTDHSYKFDLHDTVVPPLVLSVEDLGIGFLVCLVPLTLSVVAFIMELVVLNSVEMLKHCRDLLIALYVINIVVKQLTHVLR